jgi:hypothetical protein
MNSDLVRSFSAFPLQRFSKIGEETRQIIESSPTF